MRICYFGFYFPWNIRNLVIRKGLEHHGIQVVECRASPYLKRSEIFRALWQEFCRIEGKLDAIVVAESNQLAVPLARYFATTRGITLVFDPLYSLYDTNVLDRRLIREGSLEARRYFWLDKISMALADYLLADTEQHRDYYVSAFKIDRDKIFVAPVGADETLFHPRPYTKTGEFSVVFWGKFIPLHGIEYILEATKILRDNDVEIELDLIGSGQTFEEMVALADRLGLTRVNFIGFVQLNELPMLMAKADVCLGIFGQSEKAKRVVACKVYAGLAMRKPVITGDSPAIRALFEHRQHLYSVPMANAQALAEGITELQRDTILRGRIAHQGHELFCAQYTTKKIGERVKAILEAVVQA
jgi:glycosyltransferase involved in cell wall biosynthesis